MQDYATEIIATLFAATVLGALRYGRRAAPRTLTDSAGRIGLPFTSGVALGGVALLPIIFIAALIFRRDAPMSLIALAVPSFYVFYACLASTGRKFDVVWDRKGVSGPSLGFLNPMAPGRQFIPWEKLDFCYTTSKGDAFHLGQYRGPRLKVSKQYGGVEYLEQAVIENAPSARRGLKAYRDGMHAPA